MKLISWNVNGLRACEGKGFSDAFKQLDADFFCLQETKMQQGQLDLQFDGYKSYWNYAEKKGYSGTAIFTKHEPISVTYGLGIDEHDHEGRVITLEMPDFYLVTVYTPNSQDGLKRLDYRMKWEDDFREYRRTRRRTVATPVSPMRSARNSPSCSLPASLTHSATSTPTSKAHTRGGRTASMHARRTQAGASTTSSFPTVWPTTSSQPASTMKSTAPTIAR